MDTLAGIQAPESVVQVLVGMQQQQIHGADYGTPRGAPEHGLMAAARCAVQGTAGDLLTQITVSLAIIALCPAPLDC